MLAHVKQCCLNYAKSLIYELQHRFPNHELMLALGVIYPNFWVDHTFDDEDVFHQHLTITKATYYVACKIGKYGV
jgi:hypothetical protein